MKDSTIKVCEYLCTPEAKQFYKQRLDYHFSEWSGRPRDWQPIYDRFYDYALIDTVEQVVQIPPEVDTGLVSDMFLDAFSYEREDETYGSKIPRIMARVTKPETMLDRFGWILDECLP